MGQINVHQCDIPHFKETIIMAFKCDHCGYRSNEIKSGGAISEKGKRITLHVETDDDLKRDVLKSETATLIIPEVCLELAPGTLGGFFSTIEGSITQVRDQLQSLPQVAFSIGDSASGERTMLQFVEELNKLIALEKPFTFVLDDPLSNIYIQNPRAHLPPPDDEDPKLTTEEYERTFEQDDELGINDMRNSENATTKTD
ncbi:zinc-finger protein ZPR1 [Angomonas deanei]|nr:zinc-finger protein ZPR1 [Angomonas deanei]|eukprot:EPY41468.1 zinc-finger protein ZPR1 [Angomonas deanei]